MYGILGVRTWHPFLETHFQMFDYKLKLGVRTWYPFLETHFQAWKIPWNVPVHGGYFFDVFPCVENYFLPLRMKGRQHGRGVCLVSQE